MLRVFNWWNLLHLSFPEQSCQWWPYNLLSRGTTGSSLPLLPSLPSLLPPLPSSLSHTHHHHHQAVFHLSLPFCVDFRKTSAVDMSLHGERETEASKRRRERRLRSWLKHQVLGKIVSKTCVLFGLECKLGPHRLLLLLFLELLTWWPRTLLLPSGMLRRVAVGQRLGDQILS